jgi:uncharacterized protein YndB with AHSA1/START domain
MTADLGRDLTISRIIKAPRAIVWEAWTDPKLMEEWWCPVPWRAEVQAFDLRPGGAFDTLMRGPDGEENPHPGSFLDVVPMERIVFTTALTEGWRPAAPWLAMTAIITMKDHPDGTDYSAVVKHADRETRDRHEALGFYDGWGAVLEQFAAIVEKRA